MDEGSDTPDLIPRQVLFGNPDKAAAALSPDGQWIAFLAPLDGVLNVWVAPAGDPGAARAVTSDTHRGIRNFSWAYTLRHILYLQDRGGDENWRVYATDLERNETRDLTPIEGVAARLEAVSRKFPGEILIGLNDRDPKLHDVHRVEIETGRRKCVQRNDEGFAGYVTDDDYRIRLALKFTAGGGHEVWRRGDSGGWELFFSVGAEDALTTAPVAFDRDGSNLFMTDSRSRDTAALVALDIASGHTRLLGCHPKADVSEVLIHPTERTIEAVAFTHERREWQVLDGSLRPDLDYLAGVSRGELQVTSRTEDDRRWIAAYVQDDGPVLYYLYDRDARRASFLFTNRTTLEGLPLARMHAVTIRARDGLEMVGYYTLPTTNDPRGEGRPDHPLPTVLLVHGGPWARDTWGFNPCHQWLANRGYAVVSVNFRGSTGFGKRFLNAGNMEWAAKMHDDLLDAADWAVRQGIADNDRIAVMGGSYGGYATLVALTFTPERFACGVDIVGPSSLITLLESIPPYWAPLFAVFTSRVGDPRDEKNRAFLTERSPLTHVERIRRPLLIGQGANDPRVKQAESDQIVAAMKAKGIPVTYVLYPDEGHGFARPENNLSFYAVAEAFLARHLGGHVQPFGEDLEESSIQVPEGAGSVPDLEEALRSSPRE